MKHFIFASTLVTIGSIGISSFASAQFDPKPLPVVTDKQIIKVAVPAKFSPANEVLLSPANQVLLSAVTTAVSQDTVKHISDPALLITSKGQEPISKIIEIEKSLPATELETIYGQFSPTITRPSFILDLNPIVPAPITNSGSPAELSGGGNIQNPGPSYYQQPVQVTTYTQPYVQPYVQKSTSSLSTKKTVSVKSSVLSDHQSDIGSIDTQIPVSSSYGASTYAVNANINLFELILIILGVVIVLIAAGEYQNRKKIPVQQIAHG